MFIKSIRLNGSNCFSLYVTVRRHIDDDAIIPGIVNGFRYDDLTHVELNGVLLRGLEIFSYLTKHKDNIRNICYSCGSPEGRSFIELFFIVIPRQIDIEFSEIIKFTEKDYYISALIVRNVCDTFIWLYNSNYYLTVPLLTYMRRFNLDKYYIKCKDDTEGKIKNFEISVLNKSEFEKLSAKDIFLNDN